MELLDMKCAEYGNKVASKVKDEALITKALGVLQEDGVYAFFLYLKAKKAEDFGKEMFDFLKEGVRLVKSNEDQLDAIRKTFKDKLDDLVFAKELLERTLVYARYHAKALEKTEKKDSTEKAVGA